MVKFYNKGIISYLIFESEHSRAFLLQVWSTDQQDWYHLKAHF